MCRPASTRGASQSASGPARYASDYGAFVSDHGPNRLVADAELGGQFTQRAVAGFGSDRLYLLSRELPLPGRPVGGSLRSARDVQWGAYRDDNRPNGPIPVASAN